MSSTQSRYWCFTVNNYSEDYEQTIQDLIEDHGAEYVVAGREVSLSGTRHLQGFVIFKQRKRFGAVRRSLPAAHIEAARGTPFQAATYCKKENDFIELGEAPVDRPTRSGQNVFDGFLEWVKDYHRENGRRPSEREIGQQYPALYVRYHKMLQKLIGHNLPLPVIQDGELRDWQINLNNQLTQESEDRVVNFYVDSDGGAGKSFFTRWFLSNNEQCQVLSIGKRDDIAHVIDPHKSVFIFDIPRGGMEFLQYSVLEKIKDRLVFSPKYEGETKVMVHKCHVVVFCNEQPDQSKLTHDRFNIIQLS